MSITPTIRLASLAATLDALDEALQRHERGEVLSSLVAISKAEVAKLQTGLAQPTIAPRASSSAQILSFPRRASSENVVIVR